MSEIAAIVKGIIADKLGADENEVTGQTSFTDDLGADSLDVIEIILECEKQFKIGIPDDQVKKLTTVGSVIEYIEKNSN